MRRHPHVKLEDVVVLDGGAPPPSEPPGGDGAFALYVDRSGLTLHLMAVPDVERRWLWSSVEGFRTTAAGETREGRLRTSVDLTVDGRPLRLLVPAEQLPASRLALLQKMVACAARDEQCSSAPAGLDGERPSPADGPAAVAYGWGPPGRTAPRRGRRAGALATAVAVAAAVAVTVVVSSTPGRPAAQRVAVKAGNSPAPAPGALPSSPARGSADPAPAAGDLQAPPVVKSGGGETTAYGPGAPAPSARAGASLVAGVPPAPPASGAGGAGTSTPTPPPPPPAASPPAPPAASPPPAPGTTPAPAPPTPAPGTLGDLLSGVRGLVPVPTPPFPALPVTGRATTSPPGNAAGVIALVW